MGSNFLNGLIESAEEGLLCMDLALETHLLYNLCPPIHRDFHESARQAIRNVNEGKGKEFITLPNGWRLTGNEICEQLRLWEFTNLDEKDEG